MPNGGGGEKTSSITYATTGWKKFRGSLRLFPWRVFSHKNERQACVRSAMLYDSET